MILKNDQLIKALYDYPDPIVGWKMDKYVKEIKPAPRLYKPVNNELVNSPVIQGLLCNRTANGEIPFHPYDKWFGAHWILYLLADLGYPVGDQSLKPLLEQSYAWLLSKEHEQYIRTINGRVRRCASQEGNCIYYSLALGIADDRTEELASRLMKWQWEDGGWNCDKRPEANKSSFHESLIPLRGLVMYAKSSGSPKARNAVERVADVFLRRQMYLRLRDDQIMDRNFVLLHYPSYWHYDILFGLKVLSEAGFINDPRCDRALDLLESKQLVDGGFPAEARYYRVDEKKLTGHSHVDWGGTSKLHMNPYVTIDALTVLQRSGRFVA